MVVHPDPAITLKGVSRLIRTRLSNEALQNPGEVVHQVSIVIYIDSLATLRQLLVIKSASYSSMGLVSD